MHKLNAIKKTKRTKHNPSGTEITEVTITINEKYLSIWNARSRKGYLEQEDFTVKIINKEGIEDIK